MRIVSIPHLTFIAFLFGFVWDSVTLSRVDQLYDIVVIGGYLLVVTSGLIILYTPTIRFSAALTPFEQWVPILVQFSMGGLLGSSLVYYAKSSTFFGSWPFLLLVMALILFNEFFHRKIAGLTSQSAIFYFILYLVVALYSPIIVGSIGPGTFALSGIIALIIASVPVAVITVVARSTQISSEPSRLAWARKDNGGDNAANAKLQVPNEPFAEFTRAWKRIGICWLVIFGILNSFYALNIIPPIPLALKDIGIYHHVLRLSTGDYEVTYESRISKISIPYLSPKNNTMHILSGESLFAWSAVFAPSDFSAPIYHRWEWHNPETNEWDTMGRIRFQIGGGREGGFRGYTEKLITDPGRWRVSVETERGAIVGRISFNVVVGIPPEKFITITK